MSPKQAEHYLSWAENFYQAIGGRIGHIEGDALHLWHGDIQFRGYETRYVNFEQFDYNPMEDIKQSPNGALYWATEKPDLHAHTEKFFEGRKRMLPKD